VDPNNDPIAYTWLLDGIPSVNLVSNGNTATLTGVSSDVGSRNVQVIASDGTASATKTFLAEVNHFPSACNSLAKDQICTYAGNPSIGDGINPTTSTVDEKIRSIGSCQDSLGNFFMTDYTNHVVWYYNQTGSAVSRLGQSIAAGTLKVVAGSGEAVSGGDGVALQSGLYYPRGCAYHTGSNRLFISEWSGSKVKYVDNNGFVFGGMGFGSSTTSGDTAYNHDCDNPSGMFLYGDDLYVTCRSDNMVRRWNLNTDQAYVVLGDGGGNIDGDGGDPTLAGANRPYDVFVDASGFYVTHDDNNQIRFVNTSGGNVTFWAGSTPIVVADNTVQRIIGTGGTGTQDNKDPQALALTDISSMARSGDLLFFSSRNTDRIYVANNGLSATTIDGITINAGKARYITGSRGYNGTNVGTSVAQANEPYGLRIDNTDPNTVVWSDYSNFRLRKIDLSTEKMIDIVGSGLMRYGYLGDVSKPSMEHLFYYPGGVVFNDSSRELYFADKTNNRVRKVDPYGKIETVIGRGWGDPDVENEVPTNAYMGTSMNSNENMLNGIELIPDGSLVQLNTRKDSFRIWNTTAAGKVYFNTYVQSARITNIAGDYLTPGNGTDGPALTISMDNPNDVKHYNDGTNDYIFVADQSNHCIRQLDSSGTLTRVLGTCGTSGNSGPDVAAGSVLFDRPHGLTIDVLGNLIITDSWNSKIRYWNRTASPVTIGIVTVNPGRVGSIACNNGQTGSASEGVFATSARCYRPTGIDIHGSKICFSNTWRHNVRCIDTGTGKINTVAGQLEATPRAGSPIGMEQEGVYGTSATLYYPSGVDFTDDGDLFISDQYNHIIRLLKFSN
jgi:hypothetical protein